MKVINLEEYRKTKRIQEVPEKQENVLSAREIYKEALKEALRKRLLKRMRLQELEEKQSKPPTTKNT